MATRHAEEGSTRHIAILLIIAALAAGCGATARDPVKFRAITDVKMLTTKQFAPHINRVCITKESLPAEQYELIAKIDAGKVWYGSKGGVYEMMANRAHRIGADAIIEVETWFQPSGGFPVWLAYAAPHGTGKAVKITGDPKETLSKLKGEWR